MRKANTRHKKRDTLGKVEALERDILVHAHGANSIFSHRQTIVIIASFLTIALDQLTKSYVQNQTIIPNILAYTRVMNTGSSFSLLQGQNTLLAWIAIIAMGAMIFYLDQTPRIKWFTISYGILLGGIAGNFIDRVTEGYVIDFIDFSFWPTFNVADIAITLGAAALIYYFAKCHKDEQSA